MRSSSVALMVFLFSTACLGSELAKPQLTLGEVQAVLENLEKSSGMGKSDPSHPDSIILVMLEALKDDQARDYKKVIASVETLLGTVRFEGLEQDVASTNSDSPKTEKRLLVGVLGGIELWRDLAYVLLGRAYYELEKNTQSMELFSRVSPRSKFYVQSQVGYVWAALRNKDTVQAQKSIDEIADLAGKGTAFSRETKLQRAYLYLQNRKLEEALLAVQDPDVQAIELEALKSIRLKIITQCYLEKYVNESKSMTFAAKESLLIRISKWAEEVGPKYRDSEFAFLAAENYWHLASLLRTEDPTKFAERSYAALDRANEWIDPWVIRSFKESKAFLTEEALFFSVAILWESERPVDAIPRLLAIPKLFPQGQFRADAYQLLADYYYDKGEFNEAVVYYKKLTEVGSLIKSSYGVYKAAWSFYNLDQKYKALRHLERLVLHYRSEFDDVKSAPPGSLMREAQGDMLLMLGELEPADRGVEELSIFKYSPEALIDSQEKLAETYRKLGKYEDAINVFRILLNRHPDTLRAFSWMEQLLVTVLSSNRRNMLAKTLDYYVPKLMGQSGAEADAKREELQQQIVNVVLTVNKEAKKTDDADLWKSTDELYASYQKLFPDSKVGDVWYHGGQRAEALGQKWKAAGFYQKAALCSKYESAGDSALSVLRIAKEAADQASLKKEISKDDYQKIISVAQWYVQNFKTTKQKTLAEFLQIESYERLQQFDDARKSLIQMVTADGVTQEHMDKFYKHNKYLYDNKLWTIAYDTSQALVEVVKGLPQTKTDYVSKIGAIQQESAFQNAFSYEADPSKAELARKWYERTINAPIRDPAVTLKAWHNMLVSYKGKQAAPSFVKGYKNFQSAFEMPNRLDVDSRKLLFDIHSKAAQAWELLGSTLLRAQSLSEAAKFAGDAKVLEALRWDVAIGLGTYYQPIKMSKEIDELKKMNSPILREAKNQIALARLLFWNAEFELSFRMTESLALAKDPEAGALLLLRDLYSEGKRQKTTLLADIKAFMIKNREKLQGSSVLTPVWAELIQPEFDVKTIASWSFTKGRTIASITKPEAPNDPPHVQLKNKVEMVSKIISELERQKDVLKKYMVKGAPQVALTSLCTAPRVTMGAAKLMAGLARTPVKSPQWPDFISRLNQKVKELVSVSQIEQKQCGESQKANMFLPPVRAVASALCDEVQCFPFLPRDTQNLVSQELDWSDESISRADRVYGYLGMGAWAVAEYVAYGAKSVQERSLLLGIIRLAYGDSWNAVALFKEAVKDPKLVSHVKLLESRIIYRHGHRSIASDEIKGVNPSQLSKFEKGLYQDLMQKLSSHPKAPVKKSQDLNIDSDDDEQDGDEGYSLY